MFSLRGPSALAALALLATLCGGASADEPTEGQLLFETCRGCHGIDGYRNNYPSYKVPKLGGQNPQYVADALSAYKSGAREHDTMHAQAYSLTPEQMSTIGTYLSGITEVSGDVVGEAPAAAATCTACHGPNGKSIAPLYPNLAGQHADYLEHALKSYRSGARKNAIMAGFAGNLDDATIKALAEFYSSQDGLTTVRQP